MNDPRAELLDRVLRSSSALKESDLEKALTVGDEINTGSFPELRGDIEYCVAYVLRFETEQIASLPLRLLSTFEHACSTIHGILSDIRSFPLRDTNREGKRNDLISRAREAVKRVEGSLIPISAYLSTGIGQQLRESAKSLFGEFEDTRHKIQEDAASVAGIVESLKQKGSEIGVVRSAEVFEAEAKHHDQFAKKWLRATAALLLVAFVAGGWSFYTATYAPECGIGRAIQVSISKMLLLTIALFGVLWAAKNYRAHKHVGVINQHRANALRTFLLFAEGAADKQAKDAILLQASQAVFCPTLTGFDSADPEAVFASASLSSIASRFGTSSSSS